MTRNYLRSETDLLQIEASPAIPEDLLIRPTLIGELSAQQMHSNWLWQAFLMPQCITLFTSQWKSGKTTLISVLLDKMKRGGAFLGYPLRPGRAFVISEENESLWLNRAQRLDLSGHVHLLSQPFKRRPTLDDWSALIDHIAGVHDRDGLDLLVIDSLAALLPVRSENVSACMLEALRPLERIAQLNMATLLTHHPRKEDAPLGQASRGSGALPANVDIILEMYWHKKIHDGDSMGMGERDRHRRIHGFSRFAETPRRMLIELNADYTDYYNHGDFGDGDQIEGWRILRAVLETADKPPTRREILDDWPEEFPAPDEKTLWRWLDQAVRNGNVTREGRGRRNAPFRAGLVKDQEWWLSSSRRINLRVFTNAKWLLLQESTNCVQSRAIP